MNAKEANKHLHDISIFLLNTSQQPHINERWEKCLIEISWEVKTLAFALRQIHFLFKD